MARDLKLEVELGLIDKALGPIKAITQGSGKLAKQLKASRDQMKALNEQQRDVAGFRKASIEVVKQTRAMRDLQTKMRGHTEALEKQRKRADTTGSGSRCLRIHLCTRLALSPWLSATPATEAPDWAHSSMTWALKALGNVRRCRDTKPSRKWLEMVSTKNRCTPCRYLEEAGRWVRRTVTFQHLDQGPNRAVRLR